MLTTSCCAAWRRGAQSTSSRCTHQTKIAPFTNPKQVEELINAFEINIPSTNFTGYNGPGIEGPMQIHASLSGMAVYFLGLYFGDTQEGATFSPTINLWPSTQNGGLYSPSGANIQVSSTVEGKAETSYTYTYQLFGNSYSNFYSSSVPASDLTSSGLISSPPLLEDVLMYQVDVSSKVTLVRLLQLKKAFLPILVTAAGMVIDSKSQLSKAESPILVNVEGSVIDVNAE